jgi:site-specific recombinase XerD
MENQEEATQISYGGYWAQFVEFCKREGLVSFPATRATVVCWMMELCDVRELCVGTINSTALSAIADRYRLEDDLVCPTTSALVLQAKEVVKKNAKPNGLNAKIPIPVETLALIAKRTDMNSWEEVIGTFIIILMFAAVMRGAELVKLKRNHVWLDTYEGEEVLMIYIGEKKNLKGSLGQVVVLAKPRKFIDLDIVYWYKQCMRRSKVVGDNWLVYNRTTDKQLKASATNRIIKDKLTIIGIDHKPFGSQSLRKGMATAAIKAGVDLRLVKRHGGWKSDAVFIYIVDSLGAQLSVTQDVL